MIMNKFLVEVENGKGDFIPTAVSNSENRAKEFAKSSVNKTRVRRIKDVDVLKLLEEYYILYLN